MKKSTTVLVSMAMFAISGCASSTLGHRSPASPGADDFNVDPNMIRTLSQYQCKYVNNTVKVQIPLYTPGQLDSQISRLSIPGNSRDVTINVFLNNDQSPEKGLLTLKVDRYGENGAAYVDFTGIKLQMSPLGYINASEVIPTGGNIAPGSNSAGSVICDVKSSGAGAAQ